MSLALSMDLSVMVLATPTPLLSANSAVVPAWEIASRPLIGQR